MLLATMCGLPGASAQAADDPAAEGNPLEELIETGRALWEDHAPAAVREQYEFPDEKMLRRFLADVEAALVEGSMESLSAYEPQARQALAVLRSFEGGLDVADWLEPRLDFLTAASESLAPEAAPVAPPETRARPMRPGEVAPAQIPKPRPPMRRVHPQRTPEYWRGVIARRAVPANAARFVPRLKAVYRKAGIPPEWVWIAEVESSMNEKALSPAGARGLFQLMPATAERFGLRTSWPDERLDPEKSARASAEYLRFLHGRFGSWPLALAAYNAGEGRVGRLLASSSGRSFEAIVDVLPAETQFYVPKVLATVGLREGVNPNRLPAPRPVAAVLHKTERMRVSVLSRGP